MEGQEGINLEDHKERCRLCLGLFSESDVFYQLNNIIIERFGILTSVELQNDEELSSIICVSCNRNLGRFISLRDELIKKQQILYNYVFGKEEKTTDEEIHQLNEDAFELPESEYLNDDTSDNLMLVVEEGECYDEQTTVDNTLSAIEAQDDEKSPSESEYDYLITENLITDSGYANYNSARTSRPKAWDWTTEMELDLIRYRNKWKTEKTSDSSVFSKISTKFELKGFPKISGKSIKYKYDKLLMDTDKLCDLQSQAIANPVESDEDLEVEALNEPKKPSRIRSEKKIYSVWNQEKEVTLLYHLFRVKQQQPAISENLLHKLVLKEMKCEGYNNITDHIIHYHLKKLRRDRAKYEDLAAMAENLHETRLKEEEKNVSSSFVWTRSADAALLSCKGNLDCQTPTLKLSEIWQNIKHQLEFDGHGTVSEQQIRNRFNVLMRNKETENEFKDSVDDSEPKGENSNESKEESRSGLKRRYLHWTDEMKESLCMHRNKLKNQVPARELWPSVARLMESEGYGIFTAQNVMFKYFNLKRHKTKPLTDEMFPYSDED